MGNVWCSEKTLVWTIGTMVKWFRPTVIQFARENLQSRVEKENTITNVENAVFDLSILNITICMLRPVGFGSNSSVDGHAFTRLDFLPRFSHRIRFFLKPGFDTSTCPHHCLWVLRGGPDVMSDSVLKLDLWKLVIAKSEMFAITIMIAGGTKSRENWGTGPYKINAPDVKDFANLDGVVWHLINVCPPVGPLWQALRMSKASCPETTSSDHMVRHSF
ncbi:hypothetical protein Tco_1377032 [Tanacetum coccineum]